MEFASRGGLALPSCSKLARNDPAPKQTLAVSIQLSVPCWKPSRIVSSSPCSCHACTMSVWDDCKQKSLHLLSRATKRFSPHLDIPGDAKHPSAHFKLWNSRRTKMICLKWTASDRTSWIWSLISVSETAAFGNGAIKGRKRCSKYTRNGMSVDHHFLTRLIGHWVQNLCLSITGFKLSSEPPLSTHITPGNGLLAASPWKLISREVTWSWTYFRNTSTWSHSIRHDANSPSCRWW